MKNWSVILSVIVLGVIVALVAHFTGLWKTISHKELEGSFELIDVETKWVEKAYQSWPPKLVLVPAISFRIKNTSDQPLKYLYFNANFKVRGDVSNLGDGFIQAISRDPLMPGETSDPVLIKSTFGIEGTNLEHFKNSPYWHTKVIDVKLFAKSQGSQYIPVGEWEVSKTIDFKEPEPYKEPIKKEPEEKK
jgi:hypothetical protein